jgi:hypothetical protein
MVASSTINGTKFAYRLTLNQPGGSVSVPEAPSVPATVDPFLLSWLRPASFLNDGYSATTIAA